ncbi:dTDP-4-dehydrorhamnose 3,5-epimerase [Thermodesulfobium acidiphilum]|uniref:dTDP-4-dehydrorhamnose 3,5-epimerase n=1 Tax=Thermodesulfobium acidiphilum TaxID=1794699 RepID=A0A2R4VZ00_THEAF|nr:dTDP-4-dehydrorhamnose 3,5-epimerase [Thermodesulfobium acidiphilum]AWB09763.1 dTDP-4-dehydrorhamnose 3,5-epimerase [Thermodesulfobium acidiphilum]
MAFKFIETVIPEVIMVKPKVFEDERGFFLESYKKSDFIKAGIYKEFIQDNHSRSVKGVLRGLHYQLNPKAQGKLIRCIKGKIFDVAVDIRENSPTFLKYVAAELSEENKFMLWIPEGFAHGFLTLSDEAEIIYKVSGNSYSPEHDRSILWNDPEIGINWPLEGEPILSKKDREAPLLRYAEINFVYDGR